MSRDADLDLIGLLVEALQAVGNELSSLQSIEEFPWPDHIVGGMEQREALAKTLKYATELMPQHREDLKLTYRQELANAYWEEKGGVPLNEEVLEHLDAIWLLLRRARISDRALDDAVRQHMQP